MSLVNELLSDGKQSQKRCNLLRRFVIIPKTADTSAMLKFLSGLLLLTIVTGCTTTVTDRPQAPSREAVPTGSVKDLLRLAEQSGGPAAASARLKAARLSVDQDDIRAATQILALIDPAALDNAEASEFLTLSARVAIDADDAAAALAYLNDSRVANVPLTRERQKTLGLLRAEAYRLNRSYIASARERIYLDGLLGETEQRQNHDAIFATLLQVPARSLADQANKAITSDLRGWLSLAAMTRRYQDDPLRQLDELNKWKQVWPNHPASIRLPQSLTLLSKIVSERPKRIALLLPFRGPVSTIGRSVRDGFLAANYEHGASVSIDLYDTFGADIATLLQLAEENGADLIIGPLQKEDVTRVAGMTLNTPVLALNRTLDGSTNPNLYQFGLAPEDEIYQISSQVSDEGHVNALVIYPDSEWGNRNFAVFKNDWDARGGIIVDSEAFSDQRDYSDVVKSLLNVDASEQRAADLRRIIGTRFEFTPRRRQDIDFVLLLANPVQARGIRPALDRFYADNVPVYATSHIHEYGEAWIDAIDLNRIRFCDIPWKLTEGDPTQQIVQTHWPLARGQLAPFFALGVDAHRLYPRLQQLKELRDDRIFGATGILQVNAFNVIERKLMWAQFKDGRPIAAPIVFQ